jgi:hypothetical protein
VLYPRTVQFRDSGTKFFAGSEDSFRLSFPQELFSEEGRIDVSDGFWTSNLLPIVCLDYGPNTGQLEEVGIDLLAAGASAQMLLKFGQLTSGSLSNTSHGAEIFEILMPFHG